MRRLTHARIAVVLRTTCRDRDDARLRVQSSCPRLVGPAVRCHEVTQYLTFLGVGLTRCDALELPDLLRHQSIS